ncbi:hypothetical protein NDU88_002971 [Pleurodeles waltl]|uniref:Uncharacterized protein n=1 Tax=Pleurodeles waltl TaxID=8319 RepID=A0AAV7NPM8_PLEWA|nr:hypothetical protein NDU88_002971 [Pleurodeles waltl]
MPAAQRRGWGLNNQEGSNRTSLGRRGGRRKRLGGQRKRRGSQRKRRGGRGKRQGGRRKRRVRRRNGRGGRRNKRGRRRLRGRPGKGVEHVPRGTWPHQVSETPATYEDDPQSGECPGGPAEEEITEAGNPDIQVSKGKKREVGQRARGPKEEEDEEEEDAGVEDESVMGDNGNTERGEDAGKGIPDIGGEEPNNERLLGPRGDTTEGQGGPKRQQLCHVPGGAWFQQVRSCLKNRISAIVGREEGGEFEQREVGKGYLGKKTPERGEH